MNITTEPTRIEVWRESGRNKPAKPVWVAAVFVIVDGKTHYPPMRVREAKRYIARNNDSETPIVARTLEELMRKINSHDNGK